MSHTSDTMTSRAVDFAYAALITAIVVILALSVFTPTDATDRGRLKRSGATLIVDAETGCHYLARGFGGITPRLGRDGEQICEAR